MKVVAHRGASSVRPENTMVSFRHAIELGADAIEFDVQSTGDGHLVVIHDMSLDRTTDGHGPVFASRFDEVRHLDAGSWFDAEFAGMQVPTLAEVLSLDAVEFELELKSYGRAFVDQALAEVDAAEALDRVEFTGSNMPLLLLLQRLEPRARIGLFSPPQAAWMSDEVYEHHVVGVAETSGADVIHVPARCITRLIVDRLHDLGKAVHANDAADTSEVRRARSAGADRLSTNDVAMAIAALEGATER
ncbi:MAG: glycerophosphodiester phosphodiesterase family protein [Ilumatobacteraceae bacterium]